MVTKINLLPWRKEAYLRRERYLRIALLIVFIVAIMILVMQHFMLLHRINDATKRVQYLRQQLALLNISKPQQQLFTMFNKITELEQTRVRLIQNFENLHRGITINTQLNQLIMKKNEMKLFGKAEAMPGITLLLKAFANNRPIIQKINRQDDEYDFILSLEYR